MIPPGIATGRFPADVVWAIIGVVGRPFLEKAAAIIRQDLAADQDLTTENIEDTEQPSRNQRKDGL